MKKILSFSLALALSMTLLVGCGSGAQPAASSAANTPPPPQDVQTEVEAKAGEKINIVLWHSMGGRIGEAMTAQVEDFNKAQDKIVVEAQFQGTYDEAITKLRATTPGQGPDIMQLYDIGTRWMIDSKYALVMEDFIKKDNYDISDYEPNILSYYRLNNTLYSMPFNCSSPVIIYNQDALKKAGLDPKTAFATFDDLKATSEALVAKGGMTVGSAFPNYSWCFEQLIGMQGKDFLDNGNGRTDRATKVIIGENGAGLPLLTKWQELATQPHAKTFGKGTSEAYKQFGNGSVGFIAGSCSAYADISVSAEGKFSVGFAPLPLVNAGDSGGGTSVGGGSLWIMDNKDANKAAAAWEFIKFVTSAEQQAKWSIASGYLPTRKGSLELDFYKAYLRDKNPALQVAIDALANSNARSAGSVMGVFPQARVIIENEIETMINDKSIKPKDTLNRIVQGINAEIELYNKTN